MDLGISYLEGSRTDYAERGFLVYVRHNYIKRMVIMSKTIYAHTPPYTNETIEFERYTDGVSLSMKNVGDIGVIDYKFNEGNLIQEFKDYIDSTYTAHYGQGGLQSSEVIIDRGHGMGFFSGNVDKYNGRYGNKGTTEDHRKDILKIIHYGFFMLFEHDRVNDLENK